MRYAGLDWLRVLPEAELPMGERIIVTRDDFDLLLSARPRRFTHSTMLVPTFTCRLKIARLSNQR
jgi:hypothetical protein